MNKKRGFIGTIALIIVALIVLGYFHINFQSIATSPMVKMNLEYGWNMLVSTFGELIRKLQLK